MKFEPVDPRAPLPPEWQAFAGAQGLPAAWSAPVVEAIGAAWGERASAGLVRDAGEVVALAFARVLAVGPPRLLSARIPLVTGPSIQLATGLGDAGRRAAVAAFERQAPRRSGLGCVGVAWRQVAAAEAELFQRPGRPRVRSLPQNWLENRWASMDEYYAWLPAHRRQDLRRAWRRVRDDPDLRVCASEEPLAEPEAAAASTLVARSAARHRRRLAARLSTPQPDARYLATLSAQPGVRHLSYRDGGGRLLGFTLSFDEGNRLRVAMWGSAGPEAGGRPLPYVHHYLWHTRHMIERGLDGTDWGMGMTETKRRFGCQEVPRVTILAPR